MDHEVWDNIRLSLWPCFYTPLLREKLRSCIAVALRVDWEELEQDIRLNQDAMHLP
jgi:hypothetical protein